MNEPERQPDLERAWRLARDKIRRSVPDSTYRIWLEPLSLAGARAETVYIAAPEKVRTWVQRRYAGLLASALSSALGYTVEVSLGQPPATDEGGVDSRGKHLNPAYTFERFVIGEGNHLAHAAALSVAEAPAEAYNPLFIHGPPGLGKTHLLSAIANYLSLNAPALTLRYTTAEGFTNEFVNALKNAGVEAFKRRYRDLDVLLVDDIQFLEGKQNTEEEFFHTFNALYEGGSQLVLSADRIPSELSTLATRLRDRFEWGLIVAIDRPSPSTRRVILERLVHEAGIQIDDHEVIPSLVRLIDSNVRQLHGGLTRVIAHASLASRPLDSKLVERVLGGRRGDGRENRGQVSVEELQRRVATACGVDASRLCGRDRSANVVRARQIAMLLTRELTALSLPEIGRRFGGRDHSTVLNAIRRAESLRKTDADFAAQVDSLSRSIHNPDALPS